MSSPRETLTLTLSCHCQHFTHPLSLPSHLLPLTSHICHCTSCRRTTGSLFGTFVILPAPLSLPLAKLSTLTAYKTSHLTRYSCPKCGAYIGDIETKALKEEEGEGKEHGEWIVPVGLLDKVPPGLLERMEIYIADTQDGGGSVWLNSAGGGSGCATRRYFRGKDGAEASGADVAGMAAAAGQGRAATSVSRARVVDQGRLLVCRCHCGGVALAIRPPKTEDGKTTTTTTRTRYPGLVDLCASCRLTTGMEVVGFVRVPKAHLFHYDLATLAIVDEKAYDPATVPNLVRYKSSSMVERYHCATCGGSVFYINLDGKRAGDVDVLAGLMESETGARAEEWVEWAQGPDFADEALDKALADTLKKGMQHLRTEKEILNSTWWKEE